MKTVALDLEGQGWIAVAPRRSVVGHGLQKVVVGSPVEPVDEPPRPSGVLYHPQQPLAET